MFQASDLFKNMALNSLSDITDIYHYLEPMNIGERCDAYSIVWIEQERLVALEKSDYIKESKIKVLRYIFLTEIKYIQKGFGCNTLYYSDHNNLYHLTEELIFSVERNKVMSETGLSYGECDFYPGSDFELEVSSRYFSHPFTLDSNGESSELVFINFILPIMQQLDLYDQINYLKRAIKSFSLEESKGTTFDVWVKNVRLLEDGWGYEYERAYKKATSRWFKSASEIQEIRDKYQSRKKASLNVYAALSDVFTEIRSAYFELLDLNSRLLHNSVLLSNFNKVLSALDEKTQLKHLIVEESAQYADIYSKLKL